jgi:hypothetical protein
LRSQHAQLATAQLPAGTDVGVFSGSLYQWAAALTQQGSNLPFALSQRVDRLPAGFSVRARGASRTVAPASQHTPARASLRVARTRAWLTPPRPAPQLALLQRDASGSGLMAVTTITAEVEAAGGRDVLVVRGAPKATLDALVDVPTIMSGMPQAIRRAVLAARQPST